MDTQLTAALATGAGIAGCAWWAGATASMSIFTIPALIQSDMEPAQAAKTWMAAYRRGAAWGPKFALTNFLLLGYAAYERRAASASTQDKTWITLLVAGLLSLGIVPWTLAAMMPTNRALMKSATSSGSDTGSTSSSKEKGKGDKKQEGDSGEEVRVLLERWGYLNLVRSAFPLLGGLMVLVEVMRK